MVLDRNQWLELFDPNHLDPDLTLPAGCSADELLNDQQFQHIQQADTLLRPLIQQVAVPADLESRILSAVHRDRTFAAPGSNGEVNHSAPLVAPTYPINALVNDTSPQTLLGRLIGRRTSTHISSEEFRRRTRRNSIGAALAVVSCLALLGWFVWPRTELWTTEQFANAIRDHFQSGKWEPARQGEPNPRISDWPSQLDRRTARCVRSLTLQGRPAEFVLMEQKGVSAGVYIIDRAHFDRKSVFEAPDTSGTPVWFYARDSRVFGFITSDPKRRRLFETDQSATVAMR